MTNKDFLYQIGAQIYVSDNKYFVGIPFSNYDSNKSYLENYNTFQFIELTDEFLTAEYNEDLPEQVLSEYENTYSNDYVYYSILNKLNNEYADISDEKFKNFYQLFANTILEYAYVSYISVLTEIYKKTLEFYANGKTDSTLVNLKLLLDSSSYSTTDVTSYQNCGCNSSTNANTLTTDTSKCSDKYVESILLYSSQMFGDLNFYFNFFFNDSEKPNANMIDMLIALLERLLEMLNEGYNVSDSQRHTHGFCSERETVDTNIINIISNYIKVLKWVKNCEIEENTNKIKVYGTQFGEIFPRLFFA